MELYKLTSPSGKMYIGITSHTAEERFVQHCKNTSGCIALKGAIKKYGKENFTIDVLLKADDWELMQLAEIETIEKLNTKSPNGYNLTFGGDGRYGFIVSDETRRKLSVAGKGRVLTDEHRKILSNIHKTRSPESYKKAGLSNTGRKHTDEAKAKISTAHTGKVASEETKAKLSEIRKGAPKSEEHKANISKALKGNMSDEQRADLSKLKKGIPRSAETIKKMSEANLGKKQSDETRNKRSESMKKTIAMKKLLDVNDSIA
jgi:group I intron endonuclease